MAISAERRKRINRLKKIILGIVVAAIVIPIIICIILASQVVKLRKQVNELQALLATSGVMTEEMSGIYTTASVEESSRGGAIQTGLLNEDGQMSAASKEIYLTFDDGPSSNTNEILDILQTYNVKATFFVIGKTDEASIRAYQRIVAEGHTLGMHSYSHKYDEIYQSMDSFTSDLSKLQEYLYQVTGVWPRYYRFPGGSSNTVSNVDMQELITYLNENDIVYMDWNIASGDAMGGKIPKESIISNCLDQIDQMDECVILLHDIADKDTTVEALPEIIEQIQERGDAVILPVTDGTIPVQHITANK